MTKTEIDTRCPPEPVMADYLAGRLSGEGREGLERHMARCDECLMRLASCYESVKEFKKGGAETGRGVIMKRVNLFLMLAIITFLLSFAFPRYFLQFLIATLLLGVKWIIDSKNTRMLIMIQEAWRKGGEKEASKILRDLDSRRVKRL